MSETTASPYKDIPEPLPISVDPLTDRRARDFLQTITSGRIDRTALDERLSGLVSDAGFAAGARAADALGVFEAMFPFEQRTTAEGVATYYRVRYASGTWTWILSTDNAGRINGFSLRLTRRYRIFDVWLRNVDY